MAWKNSLIALGLASALLPASAALAADHRDGAAVLTDPSTDLNDVYAWVSPDGSKVNLIMTAFPAANKDTAKFSTAAYYVFHTASRPMVLAPQGTVPVDIICSFDAAQMISCWVGDNTHFVSGNANNTSGITSSDGKIKVYAGVRKDHFFFNLDGFEDVRSLVKMRNGVMPIQVDANGCVNNLTAGEITAIQTQLRMTSKGTAPPVDFFKNLNALAIVMQVDKALLTSGGSILSVWAGTHKKQ